MQEQEYSLNPGRYVGVVIEEDGKTEDEFLEAVLTLHEELDMLNDNTKAMVNIIDHNIKQILGE